MNYLPNNNFDNFYSQYEAPLPSDVFGDDTESSFQNASKKISKSDIEVRQKINRKKHNRTRNPWTPAEDKKVIELMNKHGQNWALISAGMEGRTGKQIRDRYLNKLNPNIKKCGDWTAAEDETMMKLINEVGNRWSLIASHLPGRTEGQVKNRFYSSMKRKLETNGIVSQTSGGSTVSETVSNLLESPHQDEGLKLDFGLDFDPTTMAFDLESAMNTARAYKHKGPIIFEDSYLNEVTAQDFISQNKNPCAAAESVLSFDLVQPTDFFLCSVEENKGQPEDVLGKVLNYFDTTPNVVSGVDAYFFDELRSQKMDSDFGMPDKQALLAKRKAYLELALAKTIKEMKSF